MITGCAFSSLDLSCLHIILPSILNKYIEKDKIGLNASIFGKVFSPLAVTSTLKTFMDKEFP